MKHLSNAHKKWMDRKSTLFAKVHSGVCLYCQVIDDYPINSSELQPVETFLLSEKRQVLQDNLFLWVSEQISIVVGFYPVLIYLTFFFDKCPLK